MFEALGNAFGYFGNLQFLLLFFIGIIAGLIIGIIPGIGGMLTIALVLPFIFGMSPEKGLPLLLSLCAVTMTGGSLTAILLNIPGETANTATLLDGFPMTQKGEASRAIGAALGSSAFGGMLSGIIALLMIPLILPMVITIHTSDMVLIILWGLSFIGILGGRSVIKGLISGGVGLLISFIGVDAVTGIERFTFYNPYLYDGLGLIPVALGLYALPEMASIAVTGGSISKRGVAIQGLRGLWQGVMDVVHHWGLFIRSAVIGYVIGVIPGIGSATAIFVAYGQAKQTSKHPELFGMGNVEGVIAPESANNAGVAGALLTTLAIGVPGSAIMALIIGAMMMMGITPGPEMLTTRLALSLNLMIVIIAANFIGAVICFFAAPALVKTAFVPAATLIPIVTVVIFIGAFAFQKHFIDITVTIIFAVLGITMKQYGYSRPALFVGFVLGALFEKFFFIALSMGGPLFFLTPVSLGLIVIIVLFFTYGHIKRLLFSRSKARL